MQERLDETAEAVFLFYSFLVYGWLKSSPDFCRAINGGVKFFTNASAAQGMAAETPQFGLACEKARGVAADSPTSIRHRRIGDAPK